MGEDELMQLGHGNNYGMLGASKPVPGPIGATNSAPVARPPIAIGPQRQQMPQAAQFTPQPNEQPTFRPGGLAPPPPLGSRILNAPVNLGRYLVGDSESIGGISLAGDLGRGVNWATGNIGGPIARAFGYQEHPGVPPNPIADDAHPGQWRSMTDAELGRRASMDSAARGKMPGGTLDYGNGTAQGAIGAGTQRQLAQTTAPTGLGGQFDELYASAIPMIRRKIEDGIDLTPSEQMIFTAAHNYHANSLVANQSVPHGNGMKPPGYMDMLNLYMKAATENPDAISEVEKDENGKPKLDKEGNKIMTRIPFDAWSKMHAHDAANYMRDFGGEVGPALGGGSSGAGNFKVLGMPQGGGQPQGQQRALGVQNQQSAEDAAYDRIDAANANSQAAADAHGANTYAAKKREYQARIAAAKTHKEKQRLMEAMQKELGTGGSEMMDVRQISQIGENRQWASGGRA